MTNNSDRQVAQEWHQGQVMNWDIKAKATQVRTQYEIDEGALVG